VHLLDLVYSTANDDGRVLRAAAARGLEGMDALLGAGAPGVSTCRHSWIGVNVTSPEHGDALRHLEYAWAEPPLPDTYYPGDEFNASDEALFRGNQRAASRFYAFASEIRDGRVVATNFAPDHGWLDAHPS
jgi:hypothetical protein